MKAVVGLEKVELCEKMKEFVGKCSGDSTVDLSGMKISGGSIFH